MHYGRLSLVLAALVSAPAAQDAPPKPAKAPAAAPAAPDKDKQDKDKQDKDKPAKPEKLALGVAIPEDLTMTDVAGQQLRFGDLRGKTTVVHFWSITCPYEKAAEPKLMQIASDYADDDVVVLAINSNAGEIGAQPDPKAFAAEKESERPYADIRAHAAKVELNHRVLVDHSGDIARFFGGKTTPHCFVFDAKGVLRYEGALDDDPRGSKGDEATNYVRLAVDAVRSGKEVATASTRPYG